jgi:hypothetical protein
MLGGLTRRRSSGRGLLIGIFAVLALSLLVSLNTPTFAGKDGSTAFAATPLDGIADPTLATHSLPSLSPTPGTQLPAPPAVPPLKLPAAPAVPPVQLPSAPSVPAQTLPAPPSVGTPSTSDVSNAISPVTGSSSAQQSPSAPTSADQPGSSKKAAQSQLRAAVGTDQLRRAVFRLQGCLGALSSMEKRVLVLRSGFGGAGTKTEGEVAGSLGIRIALVQKLERRGLQDLRAAATSGGCQGQGDGSAFAYAGFSPLPPAASITPPWTRVGALPVGPFAGPLAAPTGTTRLDVLAVRLLLFVGLAAVILAVGLLLHTWRERPSARRRRRFKRLVTHVAQLHVAVLTMREQEEREGARWRPRAGPPRADRLASHRAEETIRPLGHGGQNGAQSRR